MSIPELRLKIKDIEGLADRRGLYASFLLAFSCLLAFSLGVFAERATARVPVSVEMRPIVYEALKQPVPAAQTAPQGKYAASKSGTRYHLATCPGAKSISAANKVWFDTKEAAEAAGYAPASNCPGI